jgi:hypothetical protein
MNGSRWQFGPTRKYYKCDRNSEKLRGAGPQYAIHADFLASDFMAKGLLVSIRGSMDDMRHELSDNRSFQLNADQGFHYADLLLTFQ